MGRLSPYHVLIGAVFLVFLERVALVNTLDSEMLLLVSAMAGASLGFFLSGREWFDFGSRRLAVATLSIAGALVAISIAFAANRSMEAPGSVEQFVVEMKWRSALGIARRGPKWWMLRLRSRKYGVEDVAVDGATWERVTEGQKIELLVTTGRLGFDIVK